MDRSKLTATTYFVVWCYILYSIGALFFYFNKVFFDILVPVHLVATACTFSLFYGWRKGIADEDEDRNSGILTRFLVPVVVVYLLIYFLMFSKLV